jgi:hypothetical protein
MLTIDWSPVRLRALKTVLKGQSPCLNLHKRYSNGNLGLEAARWANDLDHLQLHVNNAHPRHGKMFTDSATSNQTKQVPHPHYYPDLASSKCLVFCSSKEIWWLIISKVYSSFLWVFESFSRKSRPNLDCGFFDWREWLSRSSNPTEEYAGWFNEKWETQIDFTRQIHLSCTSSELTILELHWIRWFQEIVQIHEKFRLQKIL